MSKIPLLCDWCTEHDCTTPEWAWPEYVAGCEDFKPAPSIPEEGLPLEKLPEDIVAAAEPETE